MRYLCQVCGMMFDKAKECEEHETKCREYELGELKQLAEYAYNTTRKDKEPRIRFAEQP